MSCKPLAVLSAVLLLSATASACSCTGVPTVGEAYDAHDAVFSGIVESVQTGPDDAFYQVRVTRVWKGVDALNIVIVSASSDSMCGYIFEAGREYLVFADDYSAMSGAVWTHLCTLNGLYATSDAVLELPPPAIVTTEAASWSAVKARYR